MKGSEVGISKNTKTPGSRELTEEVDYSGLLSRHSGTLSAGNNKTIQFVSTILFYNQRRLYV